MENFEKPYSKPPQLKWVESLTESMRRWIKLWWLFLMVGIIFALAGYIHASRTPIKYKSRLTFALEEGSQGSMGNIYNLASQFGLNVGGESNMFTGDNITAILTSRNMVEKVLTSVDTFDNKPLTIIEFYLNLFTKKQKNTEAETVHFPVGVKRGNYSYEQDSILYKVYIDFTRNLINAERPDRKLSIYEVSLTTPNEKLTRDFTRRLLDSTNEFYITLKTKKYKQTLDVLEKRVASIKSDFDESISRKAAIQDKNINPAFSNAEVPVLKQQSNIQVYGGAYSELFKNREIARFQYLNNFPLIQVIDDAKYPMKTIRKSRLKTALIWAVFSGFALLFILWLIRVLKIASAPGDTRS